jgi:hypothetical protein
MSTTGLEENEFYLQRAFIRFVLFVCCFLRHANERSSFKGESDMTVWKLQAVGY